MNPIDFGKFRLMEKIGQGGMAEVFYAHIRGQEGFTKEVALKRVLQHLCEDADFVKSFIDEARLGGLLNHHHIVQTLDFGQEQGIYYLAMEYVHGLTLREIINFHNKSRQPIPPTIVMELLLQFCDGLRYAHKAEDELGNPLMMVHRDLKPTNILVSSYGAVKIADFGIARAETNLRRTTYDGVLKGTAQYMSPEQALGDLRIDQRSDIFSAGSIAYELVTLRSLFYDPSNSIKTLRNVQDANIADPLSSMVRDFSYAQRLAPLLEWMLQRDPIKRPAQIDDVMPEMRRLQATLARQTDTQTWIEQVLVGLGKPVRSRRSMASRVSIPVVPPGTVLPGAAQTAPTGTAQAGAKTGTTGAGVGPGVPSGVAPGANTTGPQTPVARPTGPSLGTSQPLANAGGALPSPASRATVSAQGAGAPGIPPLPGAQFRTSQPNAGSPNAGSPNASSPNASSTGGNSVFAAVTRAPESSGGAFGGAGANVPVSARPGAVLAPQAEEESTSFSLELDDEEEGGRTIAQPTAISPQMPAPFAPQLAPTQTIVANAPQNLARSGPIPSQGAAPVPASAPAGAPKQGNIERVTGAAANAGPFAVPPPFPNATGAGARAPLPGQSGAASGPGPVPVAGGQTRQPSGPIPAPAPATAGSRAVPAMPPAMPSPASSNAWGAGMNLPPPKMAQDDDWTNVATTAINLSDAPPGFLQNMMGGKAAPAPTASLGAPAAAASLGAEPEAIPIRPGSGRAASGNMGRIVPSVPPPLEPSNPGTGRGFDLPPPAAEPGEWADIRTRALGENERLPPSGMMSGRSDDTAPDALAAFMEASESWKTEPPPTPVNPVSLGFPTVPTSVVNDGRMGGGGGVPSGPIPAASRPTGLSNLPSPAPAPGGFAPPLAATQYLAPPPGVVGKSGGPSQANLPSGFNPAQAPTQALQTTGALRPGAIAAPPAPAPAPAPMGGSSNTAGRGPVPSASTPYSPGYGEVYPPPGMMGGGNPAAQGMQARAQNGMPGQPGMPVQGQPMQAPMNQMPMNQAPMNQAPMNQAPMNQMPMNQAPMNQMPMNQAPANQAPSPSQLKQLAQAPTVQGQAEGKKMPLWAIGLLLLLLVAVGLFIGLQGVR